MHCDYVIFLLLIVLVIVLQHLGEFNICTFEGTFSVKFGHAVVWTKVISCLICICVSNPKV